jgi:hypothetical protein
MIHTLSKIMGWILVSISVAIVVLPVIGCIASGEICSNLGIKMGGSMPEVIWHGIDIGPTLYDMSMAPWLLLLTIPSSVCILPLGIVLISLKRL